MKLSFFGATRQVTGSNFLLETKRSKVVVDCGMFQGSDFNAARNHDDFAYDPKKIKAVIATHGHLDHIGRIPKLVQDGFRGPIYGTKGTLEIAKLIWEDALHIMAYEHRKFGSPMLFSSDDLPPTVSARKFLEYDIWQKIGSDIRFRLHDAGHIFGSSFIEVEAEGKHLVFSGDVGNKDVPILRETAALPNKLDALVIESTYGDRIHEGLAKRRQIIKETIVGALKKNGTLLIPAFSVERTQELLYHLHEIIAHDKSFPNVPIFLDSPLAIRATEVYREHPEYYDAEARILKKAHGDFFKFRGLKMTLSRDESKMINGHKGAKIVIAGSGMMNGGRIMHHLVRHISSKRTTIFIVGYQAEGTLGRRIYEGASTVTIMGQKKRVHAKVVAIGSLSAHADQKKLIGWAIAPSSPPKKIFTVHGEPHAATELAHRLRDKLPKSEVVVPEEGLVVEI